MSAPIPVFGDRPKAAPTPKLRALVKFPGNIIGTTGIEVSKANGNVTIETDWTDFSSISAIPTSPTSYILTFDSATGVYVLVPSHLLGGAVAGIADAPVDGVQYGRQSTGEVVGGVPINSWTPVSASGTFLQAGAGAVQRGMQDKAREIVSVKDFGAVGDGVTDESAAVALAIASLPSGGTIYFPTGRYRINSDLNIHSNLRFVGAGKESSIVLLGQIVANRGIFNAPANTIDGYRWQDIHFEHLGFDGSLCTWPVWLSKLDGTPITDPQADYVMGSGLLASGISGTSLTAVVTGSKVTNVTINNGGSGWKGHPTVPYLSNNVTFNFIGGGATRPAYGFGILSGGTPTLTSVFMFDGGDGYTSVPSVIALGGYADINLLTQPTVNRRNPNCLTRSFCIYLTQVEDCSIRNCHFLNFKSTAIQLLGCKDAYVEDCTFVDNGKDDGDHITIFILDYVNAGHTVSAGENNVVRRNKSKGDKRCFCFMAQSKGGDFAENNTEGSGMCSGAPSTNSAPNSGQYWLTIRDNVANNCPLSDFAASFCEITGTRNILFKDNVFNGCDGAMISVTGSRALRLIRNSYLAAQRSTAQAVGYGPSSESFEFGHGTNPLIGYLRDPTKAGAVTLGELNGVPMDDVICEDEVMHDDRGPAGPAMYHFYNNGAPTGLTNNIAIRNPRRSSFAASGLQLSSPIFYCPAPQIFDSKFSVWVSGGALDNGIGGWRVVHSFASGSTGDVTITGVGFPAKRVNIWAADPTATNGRSFVGSLCWNLEFPSGGRIGGMATTVQNGVGQCSKNCDNVIQLIDTSGAALFDATFVNWTMDGFVLNVFLASVGCDMIFQCFST